MDVAEAFRDLPGLAVLESARPGRRSRWSYVTADPIAIVDLVGDGADPFAPARRLLARLWADPPGRDRPAAADPASDTAASDPDVPPFLGGLVGFIGYDVGLALSPRRTVARDDQGLPALRLALHDWVVAWDRRTGAAWLGGRAVDGDPGPLELRLAAVRRRLAELAAGRPNRIASAMPDESLEFVSNLSRAAFERGVETVRDAIARGEIYQANLTRRLETRYQGDPWPLYRCLRTGDPALFTAFLDLGPGGLDHGPRGLASASPEPFLTLDAAGHVTTDPIKGTRPRGRDREADRALACELLGSAKDRAENTMIVDVLRNDLGRVCRPGSVRVPRLCRLERTAAVQHLVSTVTGRLVPGRDAFDLLAASFPGGSITGAPKLRAMEILEGLETVRRGPYTGVLGWIGPDGAMATSILIRTLVADGRRLSLNVGGGMTWRSDPAAEWEETVAKARGPLDAIGGREVVA
jgi:para-aminobenzoate synthetase component I